MAERFEIISRFRRRAMTTRVLMVALAGVLCQGQRDVAINSRLKINGFTIGGEIALEMPGFWVGGGVEGGNERMQEKFVVGMILTVILGYV
eukprot:1087478-Amorphochlora_amoeboformis.AAC.1